MRKLIELSLLTTLSIGCGEKDETDSGIEEVVDSSLYDEKGGELIYLSGSEQIKILGEGCSQVFNATEALEEMGFYDLVLEYQNRINEPINFYFAWNDDGLLYDISEKWLIMDCNSGPGFISHVVGFGYPRGTDSYEYIKELYNPAICECDLISEGFEHLCE